MKVNVHIEELVLHGLPPGDRQRIGAAIRAELAQRLAAGGVPAALLGGKDLTNLDAGSFAVGHKPPAQTVGQRVARAIDRGWRR